MVVKECAEANVGPSILDHSVLAAAEVTEVPRSSHSRCGVCRPKADQDPEDRFPHRTALPLGSLRARWM
jgi:hypothetical protein